MRASISEDKLLGTTTLLAVPDTTHISGAAQSSSTPARRHWSFWIALHVYQFDSASFESDLRLQSSTLTFKEHARRVAYCN